MRRVGRGPPALAPVPLRFARAAGAAFNFLLVVFAAFEAFAAAVAAFSRDVFARAFLGFASAMTAFVSGDVSRGAAFANVVSPAAVGRLTDQHTTTAGEFVRDRDPSGGDLVHPLDEVGAPGRR